jgi:hypothetical protein
VGGEAEDDTLLMGLGTRANRTGNRHQYVSKVNGELKLIRKGAVRMNN